MLAASACSPALPRGFSRLQPCASAEGPADAYCGTLSVFENRSTRSGRRIELAIVVLPALGDDYRHDPLVFLAGGPGQGAARMAPLVATLFRRVQRHRDIVLVDQRGTGRSNPLDCEPKDDTLRTIFEDDAAAIARLETCLSGYDADVRLYTTPIAMDDLDEVVSHLGYERINLYGGSYGTRAALVYLRQHADRVRTVTLDGVAPPDMRLPLFAARDAGRALDQVLTDCDADPSCRTAYSDLTSRTRDLLARLEREPASVMLTHPRTGLHDAVAVTPRVVASALLAGLYSPMTAAMIPLLLDRATHGDFQPLLALALAGDQFENLSVGMQLSVLCSEDAPRLSDADLAREASGTIFGPHLAEGQRRACARWPRGEIDVSYFAPVISDVPALVLSGDLDPVTPPAWGEAVTRHLRNGRHFVAAGTGHGVASTPCGMRMVSDFLERGAADAIDGACLEDRQRPPFFVQPSGPDPSAPRRASR